MTALDGCGSNPTVPNLVLPIWHVPRRSPAAGLEQWLLTTAAAWSVLLVVGQRISACRRSGGTPIAIPSPAEQRATYLAQLQPHIVEPILEVGFLSTPGAVAGLVRDQVKGKALGFLSPLVGLVYRRKKTAARVEVTRNDLVAVTEQRVYLFEFPSRGGTFTVSGPPIVWSRAGLVVAAEAQGRLTQRIHVRLASGDEVDYDINRGGRDWATFSDGMRDLLLRSS
ncbi:MAG: hypothetical protein JWN46_1225 [Acidimicrobiales bacterium]|nr:hypothetical protein [Acidimicrobiales bacterium]